jgi:tetratricopeptide (TPR) repeat protein
LTSIPRRLESGLPVMLVFAAAVGLRLICLVHIRQLPFFDHPIMDASYHDTWARQIAAGDLTRAEPFFRAPLYPYFLALIYSVLKGSYIAPRIIQALLGGFTAVLVFVLARRMMGRRAAIIAGVLCAAYPILIYLDGELLTESLFTFLCILGMVLVDSALQRASIGLWLAGGVALGLALITRPTIGLFLPMVVAASLLFARPRLIATVLVLVGMALPLVPVTTHNYAVSGEFIPLVWQGGLNFYLGNNPDANGWSATSPEIRKDWWGGYKDMMAIPRASLGRDPTFREISAFWSDKGLEYIRSEPAEWLALMSKKMAIFWNRMEFPNNQDYNFMRQNSWVLLNPLVGFGTVAPLAIMGIIVLARRLRRLYLLYSFLIAYTAATVAFFVCARYRAPVVPVLCIFAAGFVGYLIELVKRRALIKLGIALAGLAAAAVIVNVNVTGENLPDPAQSLTQVGKVYLERNDETNAVTYFEQAIASNPKWAEAYEQLGLVRMKAGEKAEAESLLIKATRMLPDLASAHRSLAMLYLSEGKPAQARVAIDQAMSTAPFLEDLHNVLGSIQRQQGDIPGAIESFRKELETNPGNWRALANLGSVYEAEGSPDEAIQAYKGALEIKPDEAQIRVALAGLYAKQGRYDLARPLLEHLGTSSVEDINLKYNQAVILQNDGKTVQAKLIYEEIIRSVPLHQPSLVNLGVIYAKEGRDQEARDLWERVLKVNPSHTTARRNIELLGQQDETDR